VVDVEVVDVVVCVVAVPVEVCCCAVEDPSVVVVVVVDGCAVVESVLAGVVASAANASCARAVTPA
jgi:hypothetical protein